MLNDFSSSIQFQKREKIYVCNRERLKFTIESITIFLRKDGEIFKFKSFDKTRTHARTLTRAETHTHTYTCTRMCVYVCEYVEGYLR